MTYTSDIPKTRRTKLRDTNQINHENDGLEGVMRDDGSIIAQGYTTDGKFWTLVLNLKLKQCVEIS